MKLILILFLFPSNEELKMSLRKYHFSNCSASIEAVKVESRKDWYSLLPSFGLGYNLQGQPRPTFSYSFGNILNYRQRKRDAAKIELSINQKCVLEFRSDSLKLESLIGSRLYILNEIEFSRENWEIDSLVFQIQKKLFEARQIKPLQWLQIKKTFNSQTRSFARLKEQLGTIEREILSHSKYFNHAKKDD